MKVVCAIWAVVIVFCTGAHGAVDPAQCSALGADYGTVDASGKVDEGSWVKGTDAGTTKAWVLQDATKPFNNKITGILTPATGKKKYLAVVLKPGEKAVLTSTDFSVTAAQDLLVNYYEATDKIVLKGCSDIDTACAPISNPGFKKENLAWTKGSYPFAATVKKLFLIAENTGNSVGVVGIDTIGFAETGKTDDLCKGSKVAGV